MIGGTDPDFFGYCRKQPNAGQARKVKELTYTLERGAKAAM